MQSAIFNFCEKKNKSKNSSHFCIISQQGGSGAGKTSLLNALCGRAYYGKVTGKIYVNGQPSSIDDHKSIVGFVPQVC